MFRGVEISVSQFVKPLDTNEASPLADHVNFFSVLALRQVWQNTLSFSSL